MICRFLIITAFLTLCVCCDEDHRNDYYDYLAPTYIDTVMMSDTVAVDDNVSVVHFYPYGCNSFERLDCDVTSDTLILDAILRFKFEGKPCAHGSGLTATVHTLCFTGPGTYVVTYEKNESTTVYQPVVAE